MRSVISDSAVRPVVIVLLDPTSDRGSRFFQAPILRRPDFLLFQAAMEPFDVAVGVSRGLRCNGPVKNDDFALLIPIIRGADMNLN